MSCALYWRPLRNGHHVGDHVLRDAVRREFGSPCRLDDGALPYLRGLAAAEVDGAQKLIDAIERHGEIEVYLEC